MVNSLRIGTALLVLGGIADFARGLSVQFTAPSTTDIPWLGTVLYAIPLLAIAVGCVAIGITFEGNSRLAFLLVGFSGTVVVVVNAAQMSLDSPFGPAPSFAAYGLNFVCMILGAVFLWADRDVPQPARWALVVPATCTLVVAVSLYVIPWTAILTLPSLGYVVSGLLIHAATRARPDQRRRSRSAEQVRT